MTWYPALYGGGGDTTVHPVLIGTFTINTKTTPVTRTLSESIDNYKYLLFGMKTIDSDSVWLGEVSNAGYTLVDVDYFKNNAITFNYVTGSSGSGTFQTLVMTYVNGTTFSTVASTATLRVLYVYGIKDMPHGHWNETVLWTNPSPSANFAAQTVTLSDNIDNYDLIGINWCYAQGINSPMCIMVTTDDLKKTGNGTNSQAIALGLISSASSDGRRSAYYASNTSIGFRNCITNTTTTNNGCIPTSIIGIKL